MTCGHSFNHLTPGTLCSHHFLPGSWHNWLAHPLSFWPEVSRGVCPVGGWRLGRGRAGTVSSPSWPASSGMAGPQQPPQGAHFLPSAPSLPVNGVVFSASGAESFSGTLQGWSPCSQLTLCTSSPPELPFWGLGQGHLPLGCSFFGLFRQCC